MRIKGRLCTHEGALLIGSVGQELSEFLEQVLLVLEQLGHLAVDLGLGEVFAAAAGNAAGGAAAAARATAHVAGLLERALLLLIRVQDLEEALVLVRLRLKPILPRTMEKRH